MTDKTLQVTSPSSLEETRNIKPVEPVDKTVYWNSSYERCWEVSLSYKTKFYLTEEEVKYYIDQIKHKKRLILIGGIVLNNRPEYISKIKVTKPLEFGETIIY
jgi:hypothetical protein